MTLFSASETNQVATVKFLLESGADINNRDYHQRTALISTSKEGANETLKLLLSYDNAEIDAVDKHGLSALIAASKNGNSTIIDLLLDAGADPFVTDKSGKSALEVATSSQIAQRLLRADVEWNN